MRNFLRNGRVRANQKLNEIFRLFSRKVYIQKKQTIGRRCQPI